MFYPNPDGSVAEEGDPQISYIEPYRIPAMRCIRSRPSIIGASWRRRHGLGDAGPGYRSYQRASQPTGPRGCAAAPAAKGADRAGADGPRSLCVFRDPSQPLIDTNVDEGLADGPCAGWYLGGRECREPLTGLAALHGQAGSCRRRRSALGLPRRIRRVVDHFAVSERDCAAGVCRHIRLVGDEDDRYPLTV